MRRSLFLLLIAVVTLGLGALAQAPVYSPRVIQFKGVPEYTHEELMAAAQLKDGEEMTVPQMSAHGKLLLDTGLFSKLNFTFNGVFLIYNIAPSENLLPIENANLPLATGKEFDEQIHARLPLYHGRVPGEGGLCEQVRATLEKMLAEKGLAATVGVTAVAGNDAAKTPTMSFSITDVPVQVGAIALNGAPVASFDEKLAGELKKTVGVNFSATATAAQIAATVAEAYRDKAYVDAKVVANPQRPVKDAEAIRVPFAVVAEAGKRYALAGIELAPGLLMTQVEFNKAVALHPGDAADAQHVKSSLKTLEFIYHNHGRMAAKIHAEPVLDRARGTVRYRVSVDPGPVYTMGKIDVVHVGERLRQAMLAEWKMQPGAVFRESAILDFYATQSPELYRVYANVNCRYHLTLNDETHTVDVQLSLERKP